MTLPSTFPTPCPHLRPHWIHTPCHRQEEAPLTTPSAALTPGWWESRSWPLLSVLLTAPVVAGRPLRASSRDLGSTTGDCILCYTAQRQGRWDGLWTSASGFLIHTLISPAYSLSSDRKDRCQDPRPRVRKMKPQGATKPELRPVVTTVCGRAGFQCSSFGLLVQSSFQ